MFAIVESGSITSMPRGNKSFKLGDTQYPASVFTLWTESERNAIGLYTVEIDETNKKNSKWYVNTNITYAFGSGKVTGSYGTATAKAHADTLWTSQDKTDNKIPNGKDVGDVATEGLKTQLIRDVKGQAESILNQTDWYVTRKAEEDTAIPSEITNHRKAVRTKQASMCTAITNASDTPALETLYKYTEQEDGSVTRPLGELPTL
tara:strand:- start:2566 stop:3180 length:615 start_codon:yes stop_codon:yes gene_type:complete